MDFVIENGELVKYNGTEKEVVIPSEVNIIGREAFANSNITKVIIGSNVKEIKNKAFKECNELKEVVIEEGLKTINVLAFSNCKNLEKINIPNTVTKIESRAFYGCDSIKVLVLPDNIKIESKYNYYIHDDYFGFMRVKFYYPLRTEIIIGNNKVSDTVKNLIIPEKSKGVNIRYMLNCKIENVLLPKGVESLNYDATIENMFFQGTIEDWLNIKSSVLYRTNPGVINNLYILDNDGDVEYMGKKYRLVKEIFIPETVKSVRIDNLNIKSVEKIITNNKIAID